MWPRATSKKFEQPASAFVLLLIRWCFSPGCMQQTKMQSHTQSTSEQALSSLRDLISRDLDLGPQRTRSRRASRSSSCCSACVHARMASLKVGLLRLASWHSNICNALGLASMPGSPAVLFGALIVCIILLAHLEGLHVAAVSTRRYSMERWRESHPRAFKAHALIVTGHNLERQA